jgi:ADP-ribosylation factor GTPase-activating protein 1
MDSFKVGELRRMEEGGNTRWKGFWDGHADGGAKGKKEWGRAGIEERYSGDVGEEYKERLSAKVEGREFVPVPKKAKPMPQKKVSTSIAGERERSRTPQGNNRSGSPAVQGGRKEKNEQYFAKLGNENANRTADLPPSQGGKYGGFGSSMPEPERQTGGAIPGFEDLQKDPVAALTKGFGWLSATVGKGVKSVNEGYIQPTAQKVR